MQGQESVLKGHWRKLKVSQNNIRCHRSELMAGLRQKTHRATETCRGRKADDRKRIDPAEDDENERELHVKERTAKERS